MNPPFIANDWRLQQSPKTFVLARLHCASGCDTCKYNGSKRYDNTPNAITRVASSFVKF